MRTLFGLQGEAARTALGLAEVAPEPDAPAVLDATGAHDNDAVDDVTGAGRELPGASSDRDG